MAHHTKNTEIRTWEKICEHIEKKIQRDQKIKTYKKNSIF